MAQAYGRRIGTDYWKPITQFGREFHATKEQIEKLLVLMRLRFTLNEYKIEEDPSNAN